MDAEEADEFALEMEESPEIGAAGIEVTEGAQEQIEKLRGGMLGLGDQLDQFDEVCGKLGAEEIGAEAVERLDEDHLAEGVEVALAAEGVADVIEEEEVELSGKGAAGAAGALCGGLEPAVGLGEPGDDPTGVTEPGTAQKDCGCAVQGSEENDSFDARGRMGKKSFMPEETTQTTVGDNTPAIDTEDLKTTYANVCRIAQTPNEVIVDFGMNANFFGNILPEPLKLESRVILSHDGAKRLMLHLANAIQSYETKYGVIELDVSKRLKKQ